MSSALPPHSPVGAARRRWTGRRAGQILVVLTAGWALLVTFTAQGYAWFAAGLGERPGEPGPWWGAAIAQLLLIGVPVLLSAWRWPLPRHRAIFRSWAWALGYLAVMTPTRLLPPVDGQLLLVLQAAITLGF